MNNKKSLVPKLRFPEFTDAWEQRKLGEVFIQTSEYINPQKHNIELWSLTVENGLTPKTDRYQRDFLVKKEDSFKLINPNEFVYNPMNITLGAIGYNSMSYPVAVSGYYITMKTAHISDDSYMNVWLKTPQAIFLYKEHATGSLIEKQRVQFNTFSKIQFNLPKQIEQQKIGSFFTALDRLITTHQRKLENVKKLKKSLLQKMFPKNGQEFSEIRFPEFTDAWEQRKLGDITNIFDNLRVPVSASERLGGTTPYYGANGIQGYIEGFTHDGEFVLVAEDGANDLVNYPIQLVAGKIWVNNHAHVLQGIESKLDNHFLVYRIKSMNISKYLVGGGRAKLNANAMKSIEFDLPKIQEQQKIGSFFTALDRLITTHQRKLENVKNLKKALLQQMFV
ncbi:restriction endonuclease subunit S [Bisgaard Taxon 45]